MADIHEQQETHDINYARKLIRECKETQNPYLDIGRCGITDLNDLPELFECTHLETLILSNSWWDYDRRNYTNSNNSGELNKLSELPEGIGKLTNLRKLIACGEWNTRWEIDDIAPLSNLTSLTELLLYNNQLTDISPLSNLTSLTKLVLESNQLTDITPLSNLTSLTQLDLDSNQLTDITPLSHLTSLTQLDLRSNKLSDISPLSNLTSLIYLSLTENQLTDLTPLRNLTSLTKLHLYNNQLTDISPLSNLTSLTQLDLRSNKLTDITPLSNLTTLTQLNLMGNNIDKIPEEIFKLNIKINIGEYGQGLCIDDNIESPPIEIIKQGNEAVLDWFAAPDKISLNQIKVILLGDGGVGKTSIIRKLEKNQFKSDEKQTDGINIVPIEFDKTEVFKKYSNLHPFKAHFWDFGGQEILNSTHQLFMTYRSLYIVVLNARKDERVAKQITRWIEQIITNGGNSRIIIIANKIDINPGFEFINKIQLHERYPQIANFIKLSADTGEGFDILLKTLAEQIPKAELVQSKFDIKWLKLIKSIKEYTQKKNKDYIDDKTFYELCDKIGIEGNDRKYVVNTFNEIGIFIHFDKIEDYDYYILEPQWITFGIYQILTSQLVAKNNGLVPFDKLDFILNDEEDKSTPYNSEQERKKYSKQETHFLIKAMKCFNLCFITNCSTVIVIPSLLKTEEPQEQIEHIKKSINILMFKYEYPSLPTYVIPNLMVKFHEQLIDYWRTGFVISFDNTKAYVSSFDDEISIYVTGNERERSELLVKVRFEIEAINKKMRTKQKRFIFEAESGELLDYDILLDDYNSGDRYYKIRKPKRKEKKIRDIFDGIIPLEGEITNEDIYTEMKNRFDRVDNEHDRLHEDHKLLAQKLDGYYEELIARMDGINKKHKNVIYELREIKELDEVKLEQHKDLIEQYSQKIIDIANNNKDILDDKLLEIVNDLKETPDLGMKLKLSVPLIPVLNKIIPIPELEFEIDVMKLINKFIKKHDKLSFLQEQANIKHYILGFLILILTVILVS